MFNKNYFSVIIGCLVLHQRYKKRYQKYLTLSKEISSPETDTAETISPSPSTRVSSNGDVNFTINTQRQMYEESNNEDSDTGMCNGGNSGECCSQQTSSSQPNATNLVVDIEDLVRRRINRNNDGVANGDLENIGGGLCSSQFNCAGTSRQSCQNLIQKYEENSRDGLEPIEFDDIVDDHQTLKHTVLLILLLCSMFVSLALSIWTLVMEGMSGIYVELSFLDAFLNFGQSIIVLAVFITDTGEFLNPLKRVWRNFWYGANVMKLPTWSELNPETQHVCEKFTTHHLDICRKTIAKDRRHRMKTYRKVFYGNEFVDWIIDVGLAHGRMDATQYAKRLLDGRILRHINNAHHFHDKNLLYTFCSRL